MKKRREYRRRWAERKQAVKGSLRGDRRYGSGGVSAPEERPEPLPWFLHSEVNR